MKGYLAELRPLLARVPKTGLSDTVDQHAIERLFQLVVDAALDVNTHIIIQKTFESADDYQSTFAILARHGVIPSNLANLIAPSVGLRNRLVHDYDKIDVRLMLTHVNKGVDQYDEYIATIIAYLDAQ